MYDSGQHSRSMNERLQLLLALLAIYNPEWDSSQFTFHNKSKTLSLYGPNLKNLRYSKARRNQQTLLKVLSIKHLHLKDCSIESLDEINGLDLLSLDISGTKIKDLKPLRKQESIQSITITSEQALDDSYLRLKDKINFNIIAK